MRVDGVGSSVWWWVFGVRSFGPVYLFGDSFTLCFDLIVAKLTLVNVENCH